MDWPKPLSAALAGTVAGAVAVLLLVVAIGTDTRAAVGFALGVATVGTLGSVGAFVLVFRSAASGDTLYPATAGALSASVLLFGTVSNLNGGERTWLTLALVGANLLVIAGFLLFVVARLWARR